VLPQIVPAELARSLAAFNDPDWLSELKHDGFRWLAYIENGQCRLVSRHRNTYKGFENPEPRPGKVARGECHS